MFGTITACFWIIAISSLTNSGFWRKKKHRGEHLLSIMLLIKFVCGDLSYFYKYMTSDLGAAQDNTSVLLNSSN